MSAQDELGLLERVAKERDRHVIGYPGPRRDVAELLDQTHAALTSLIAERDGLATTLDMIREEAGKSNSPFGRSDSLALDRIRTALSLDTNKGDGV
jgi:hypothetical protein